MLCRIGHPKIICRIAYGICSDNQVMDRWIQHRWRLSAAARAGTRRAFMAADLGLRVALVDLEPNPGGVCLYRGCIPSKALLHVAKVIGESRQAADWGLSSPSR